MLLSPANAETAPVHGGHRSDDGCGINTQHIRRATNNKNARRRNVRLVCGWKINKTIYLISNDENFFTDAVRHTVHNTSSSSAVAFVIGVKLKRNEKNPTTINIYLRENEIFAARKGQGRCCRRQRRIKIYNYKICHCLGRTRDYRSTQQTIKMLPKRPTTLPRRREVRITGSGGAMLDTLATAVGTTVSATTNGTNPDHEKTGKKKKILTVSLKIYGLGSNNNRGRRHLRVIIIIF